MVREVTINNSISDKSCNNSLNYLTYPKQTNITQLNSIFDFIK